MGAGGAEGVAPRAVQFGVHRTGGRWTRHRGSGRAGVVVRTRGKSQPPAGRVHGPHPLGVICLDGDVSRRRRGAGGGAAARMGQ